MRRPSAGSSLVRFVTPLKQRFECCTVVCNMICLAHTVGFAFTSKVPRKAMVAPIGILWDGLPFGLHFLNDRSKISSETDLLRQRCFTNHQSVTIAIIHVCCGTALTLPPPWSHSWWIRIFRCKWRRCWGTDTTLPDVEGAVELSEGWNPMGFWNPRGCDGIIDPPV